MVHGVHGIAQEQEILERRKAQLEQCQEVRQRLIPPSGRTQHECQIAVSDRVFRVALEHFLELGLALRDPPQVHEHAASGPETLDIIVAGVRGNLVVIPQCVFGMSLASGRFTREQQDRTGVRLFREQTLRDEFCLGEFAALEVMSGFMQRRCDRR